MERIDLRSDTVTVPTQAMRRAMARAEVGDDVLGEDPTVNALQEKAADLLGKEAALFVPSGTFANQCAILTHADSGDEVLLAERCHIVQHEAGAAALLSRAQLRPLSPVSPHVRPEDIRPRIRAQRDIHFPKTALVCVEQATSDGTVVPLRTLEDIARLCAGHRVPVYMDGARIFNAAAALGVKAREIAKHVHSVGFCLSKGLCAPVGSVLAGPRDFIERARYNRKRMGGGMRQAGVLAAAGLVALRDVLPRLKEDHEKASLLARLLAEVPGLVLLREPEINMVFVSLRALRIDDEALVGALRARGMLVYPPENGVYRFVVHHQVTEKDVRAFAREFRRALG